MLLRRVLDEVGAVLLRSGWYRYDFFDGTNVATLVFRYVFGSYRRDWKGVYEDAIALYVGVPHAITFGAGRMALYAILEALDVGEGDEVIVPAFTCVVVPNAILYRGARPVYVDICAQTYNIDVTKIEEAITPRTRAILAQHTFGQPCDIESILKMARRHNLVVIEDCAHAFGESAGGKRLGSFGDVAFVSTDHSKVISTSLGGFVICSDWGLAEKLRHIQRRSVELSLSCRTRIMIQYGLLGLLNRPGVYWAGRMLIAFLGRMRLWFYFHDELKTRRPEQYPVKLTDFQAFVGCHEMERLESNIAHRREVASGYHRIFERPEEHLPEGAYLRYSILVRSPDKWQQTIGKYFTIGRWFSSVAHGRTENWHEIGYEPGSCPVAEFVALHIINFPTHFRVDETAVMRLRRLVERHRLKPDMLEPAPDLSAQAACEGFHRKNHEEWDPSPGRYRSRSPSWIKPNEMVGGSTKQKVLPEAEERMGESEP